MTSKDKFIEPEEVVRHKDGRVDLFSTILARKDSTAQIPVLSSTRSHTTSSLPSPPIQSNQQYRAYSASAPHYSEANETPAHGNQRKRHQSRSPQPSSADSAASSDGAKAAPTHVIKALKGDFAAPVKDTPFTRASGAWRPQAIEATVSTTGNGEVEGEKKSSVGTSWGGRSFERNFIGYVDRPSTIPSDVAYWHDEDHVILKDGYPKAKIHMLVLPRQSMEKITQLSGPEGIKMVRDLVERANWLVERLKEKSPTLDIVMGFHAIPSMLQLHLHVISQDFCGEGLKKKHHWNSFTTPFFISPEQVIHTIQQRSSFAPSPREVQKYEVMLKQDLKCNQCSETLKNMPTLKKHLQGHYLHKQKDKV